MKKIGKISHFYDKIGVAVITLTGPLSLGDTIKISGNDMEFTQTVTSMQIEHEQLKKAGKGQEIGLKIDQPVKEGDQVFIVKK